MRKRTAAEADFDRDTSDFAAAFPVGSVGGVRAAAGPCTRSQSGEETARQLLESPVPLTWERITENVEPAGGACHTRVRAAPRPKQGKLPLDDAAMDSTPQQDHDDDDDDDDVDEQVAELTMSLPPLIDPRPHRIVSPDLVFEASRAFSTSAAHRTFRPIDRPDVEVTSPPPRAMNPVVLDSRFKNMQRLDLRLDARDAPLQPFHRPYAQRRVPGGAPTMVFAAPAKVLPLAMETPSTS